MVMRSIKLLNRCIFYFLVVLLPVFAVSVTMTSCDKLIDLIEGGEEDEDNLGDTSDEGYEDGFHTSDGKEPYFKFGAENIVVPACGYVDETYGNNTFALRYETNIADELHFCLESFKKFNENGGQIESADDIPFFIFREPDFYVSSPTETIVYFNTNAKTESITDKLLVYGYNNPDSIIASIQIMQEAGKSVRVVDYEKSINSVVMNLEASEGVYAYGIYSTEDSIPLSEIQREAVNDNNYDRFRGIRLLEEGNTYELEGLDEGKKYFVYIAAKDKFDNFSGITQTSVTTDVRGEEHELRMKFALTSLNENTVYLPFWGNVRGYITWGDGSEEYIDKYVYPGDIRHSYKISSQEVVVAFRGSLEKISMENQRVGSVMCKSLLSIEQWGDTDLLELDLEDVVTLESIPDDLCGAFSDIKSFENSFKGCTSITSIPSGLFSYAISATDFESTFEDCTGLTEIPENLFANCTSARSFDQVFYGCSNLEMIPEKLFYNNSNVVSMQYAFSGCSKLVSIPAGLFKNNTYLNDIKCMFYRCSSLKTIPEGLFSSCHISYITDIQHYQYGNLYGLFTDCTSLESIPSDLFSNMGNVDNMGALFRGCSSLKALPEGLFDNNKNVTFFEDAFNGCTSLTTIPVTLFDNQRKIVKVKNLFNGCSSLIGESPYTMIDGKKVHLYERNNPEYNTQFIEIIESVGAFRGCNKLDDYDNIPNESGNYWK